MVVRRHIQRFFDTYDPRNGAHARVLKMLVEGVHNDEDLQELEELAGTHVDELRATARAVSVGRGAASDEARFDSGRRSLFNSATGDGTATDNNIENLDNDNVKKPRIDDDVAIPGIGDFFNKNDHLETPSKTTSTEVEINSLKNEDFQLNSENSINKEKLDLESIFYQNVFVPSRPSYDTSLSATPRDPSYLFPPLQCKLCGLRFASSLTSAFGIHIEDHRRKTRALGDKIVLRREFFNSRIQKVPVRLNLSLNGGAEAVVWNKECPQCIVCGSVIRKAWRDDVEDWVLDGGTRVNDREFAHRECVL